jgi:hypothetical protein
MSKHTNQLEIDFSAPAPMVERGSRRKKKKVIKKDYSFKPNRTSQDAKSEAQYNKEWRAYEGTPYSNVHSTHSFI